MRGLSDNSAFDTFERMHQKVEQIEAESEASTELGGELTGDTLQQKFKKLEGSSGSDMALAELKAKMGLGPAPEQPALPGGQNRRGKAVSRTAGSTGRGLKGRSPSVPTQRLQSAKERCYTGDRYGLQKESTHRWHNIKTTRRRASTA